MVSGMYDRPAALWATLGVALVVFALPPVWYMRRYVEEATPGLLAGSYVLTLASLIGVPVLPLMYLARTGGILRTIESMQAVTAAYLFGLLVATLLYAAVLRWRLGTLTADRTRVVAVAALPATNLLFLLASPGLFVFSVFVGNVG